MFDTVCLVAIFTWVIIYIVGFVWVIVRDIIERILRDKDYTDYRGG